MEKSKKYYSSKQEHMVADTLGWKVTSGSGSRAGVPGDVESSEWLGECKTYTTSGHKINFKVNDWTKIREEATSKMKFPVLFTDDGTQRNSATWCMFPQVVDADFVHDYILDNIVGNFGSTQTKSITVRDADNCKNTTIYSLRVNGRSVFITRLETFKRLLGGA